METISQLLEDLRMSPGQATLVGLFLLTWLLGVLSWLWGLLEHVGVRRLSEVFFASGPVMWRGQENLPPRTELPGTRLELPFLSLKVTGPDRLIFTPSGRPEPGSRSTPVLKGEARWEGGAAQITVRGSFAPVAFMTAWLSLCVIGAAIALAFSVPTRALLIPAVMFAAGLLFLKHLWRSTRQAAEILGSEASERLRAV
ncbi:MAG: hypothetical protein JSW03_02805 [Candidatus Eiseniibacteriota bacterium]|nr:MAG: hypothetical protein JSW03_02805 [Candidatus Eisenbacteria bacterium]